MKKFSLKNIKNSSVYVTPNFEHLQTKRYKFSISTLFLYLSVYTSIILLILLLIFFFTPMKNLFLILENEKIAAQSERIENLEEKITFLTNEIEVFASSNRRMKYAIMLATNDSLDTTSSVYDSLKSNEVEKLHPEGDILSIAKILYDKFFCSNQAGKEEYFLSPIKNAKIINNFDANNGHLGNDIAAKIGTPISAISDGLVLSSDYSIDSGYKIILEHKNGYISIYKHCSVLLAKERDKVKLGQIIAFSGNSGVSTGPHLHLEIWQNGIPIDPSKVIVNISE